MARGGKGEEGWFVVVPAEWSPPRHLAGGGPPYLFAFWRKAGALPRVNTTISSPVTVLIS